MPNPVGLPCSASGHSKATRAHHSPPTKSATHTCHTCEDARPFPLRKIPRGEMHGRGIAGAFWIAGRVRAAEQLILNAPAFSRASWALVAAGLLAALSSPGKAQERGACTARQPSNSGRGAKVGIVSGPRRVNYYISAFHTKKDNPHQRARKVGCKSLPLGVRTPSDLMEKGHSLRRGLKAKEAVGECVGFSGWRFEVLEMDGRRVDKVRASREPAAEP